MAEGSTLHPAGINLESGKEWRTGSSMKRFTPLALLCLLPVLFVACHSTEARDRKDAQLRKESIERDRAAARLEKHGDWN